MESAQELNNKMINKNQRDTSRCREKINLIQSILRKQSLLTYGTHQNRNEQRKNKKKSRLELSLCETNFVNI